jgi:hypothetical protein
VKKFTDLTYCISPKTAGVQKLKSYWLKRISKAISVVMKGFPKGFHSHINRFPKLLQKLIRNLRKCLLQQLLEKFVHVATSGFQDSFMTAITVFGKVKRIFMEAV